jgi:hypothetical protein
MVVRAEPDPLPPERAARQQAHLHDAGTDTLALAIQALPEDDAPQPRIGRVGFPSMSGTPTTPSAPTTPTPATPTAPTAA